MTRRSKHTPPPYDYRADGHGFSPAFMTLMLLLTIPPAVLSVMLNAQGLFNKAVEAGVADTIGIISALATAIVAGLLVGAGQMLLFSVTMNAHRKQRGSIISLTAVLLVFAYGISAVSNAMATCGAPSLVYTMRERLTEYTLYVENAVKQRIDIRNAADALTPKRDTVCLTAEKELSSGIVSGSRGYGALAKNYTEACANVTKIVEILEQRVTESATMQSQADVLLKDLEATIKNNDRNVFERVEDFRDTASALRRVISGVSGQNVDDLLRAQLEILEGSVMQEDIASGAFGQKQRAALAELKASLTHFANAVRHLLDKNGDTALTPPEDIPDMIAAIWDFKGRNTPQLLISFLIDSFSIYLVFLLGVMRRTAEIRRQERHDVALPKPQRSA